MLDAAAESPRVATIARSTGALAVWVGALLAFIASAATLVLELVAGRMLAPYVGSSLYTWTSIIGVVLAGISVGNWLGGRLADRAATARTTGLLFLLGAIASASSLLLVDLVGGVLMASGTELLARIFLLSAIGFFPASCLLAMITPVVIRRSLPDVRNTGRIVGTVYACATAGSLAGNFATGFVLTAYFNVTTIVLAVSVLLLAIGLVEGQWWRPADLMPVARGEIVDGVAVADAERSPFSLAGNVVLAGLIVTTASFATMGIELSASRILAPYLGLSLYSWTGIIGVVLAAITVGNYLGGLIADRWPRQHVLGLSLFLGGLGSLAILKLVDLLNVHELWTGYGLVTRIVLETAAVFFVPLVLLGLISPQVTRLTVTDLRSAGRIAGAIYALSTLGAIVGTFATGWWLISALGVHTLVFALALVLVALGLVVGRFWRQPVWLAGLMAVSAGTIVYLNSEGALRSRCTMETNYFCIKVGEEERTVGTVKTLVLDHLVHSYVKVGDPSYLGYVHEEVQAEITRYMAVQKPDLRVLVIGGGGYTYPRWVDAMLPSARVEVVEIDPGVTEVVHEHFGLPRDTEIVSHNLDGRQFVQEIADKAQYGLVVQDAVNDLSVPYHIMTREYNDQVRKLLAPDGVYLLTVIDLFDDGQLLRSAARTMMQTFPRVQLLSTGPAWESGGANVWVIAGSAHGIDLEHMRETLARQGVDTMRTTEMPEKQLRDYVDQGPQIILTDEYAPVDNLIAILFRSRE